MLNDIFSYIIQWFNNEPVIITIIGFVASIVAILSIPIILEQLRELTKKKRLKKQQAQITPEISTVPKSDQHSTNFTAQLGNKNNPRLLPKEKRLAQLKKGQNPYVCGSALSSNSAVFYGRARELLGTLSVLGSRDKPGNVSILGERRIGKSSLLNQIYQVLAVVPHLVTIQTTMQGWSIDSQATFFTQLHKSISDALEISSGAVDDFASFRDFIRDYAEKGFRFILIIDEFDLMTDNAYFTAEFFSNMRALGEGHEYQFAYVLSSYAPLSDICHEGGIQESKFWNIFGTCYILGLLTKREAEQLIQEPMRKTLEGDFDEMADILAYAGCHPAFIQIAASEYWLAKNFKFAVNADAIQQTLYNYYQDLWQHRTKPEQQLLLQIANNEPVRKNHTLTNLRQRGLVDPDNQLFARFFKQVFEQD